jgi:hypothetical protein
MLESRLGDLREQNLNRQGMGHFHVSGRGHEAMAAIGLVTQMDDFASPYYYRGCSFVLGRGVTTPQVLKSGGPLRYLGMGIIVLLIVPRKGQSRASLSSYRES